MKKLLVLLVLLLLAFGFYYGDNALANSLIHKYLYISACETPVRYREGTVDPQFGISDAQFLTDMNEATAIWDKAYGKTLYVYDPTAQLTVSLIYDGRQTLDTQINNLQGQISSDKQNMQPKITEYENMSADFKTKMAALNSQIESWNQKGGAPPAAYQQLLSQQLALQSEASQLNALGAQLNESADIFNSKVGQLNQTIQTFNAALAKKPEEGLYDGANNTITIYFDDSQTELIHTLAHEFGHSRGLGHNQNPNSIMFPYTNLITTPSPNDMAALDAICKPQSVWDIAGQRYAYDFQMLKTEIQTLEKQYNI